MRLPLTLTTASRAVAILPALSCVSMSAMTACGACGRRVRRPKRCGKRAPPRRSSSRACDRVFHIAGGIQRPSGATRPTRMPQERRPRPRPPCNYPPLQPLSRMVRISGRAVAGVYGAAFVRRRDGSVSARRCAAGSPRSLVGRFGWGPPSRLGSHVRVQCGPPAARSTLEHVRVVEEAVEERGHRRGVAEELPPVVHGSV